MPSTKRSAESREGAGGSSPSAAAGAAPDTDLPAPASPLEDAGPEHPPPRSGSRVAVDAPALARDIRDAVLIKDGDLFLLTDLAGNIPPGDLNGFGLYFQDTRFLSGYELVIEGLHPTILLSGARSHFMAAQVLTNAHLILPDGEQVHAQTLQIRRYRVLRGNEASESIVVQSFNTFPLALDLALHFDADFADMFQVRSIVSPEPRGRLSLPSYENGVLTFRYAGRDGIARETIVSFDPPPARMERGSAIYVLDLPAHGSERVALKVRIDESVGGLPRFQNRSGRAAGGAPRQLTAERSTIDTSNALLNALLRQSHQDLMLLLSGDRESWFVAAGIPWYATLFGRDALITALAEVWLSPSLARQTLRVLARFQGTRDDPWRDEEPGKIPHELRRGEIANLGLVPFTPYYGTVDATPLWVMLLGRYHDTTGDLELVRELLGPLEAALVWIDRFGDLDGDGFIEYRCRSSAGLVNQGWKDSSDGIVHADGSMPEPPIALVEAQAYVYAAKRAAGDLYHALGERARAEALVDEARRLRSAFNEAFWMPDEGFYCVALDGKKRQVASIASNAGHALWCGIVSPDRGDAVARRLMAEDLFNGWGIRTLSAREVAYNPTGYHVGTVWPHDNAIIALALKRSNNEALALELIAGMFDAAQHFPSFRMPELFCGFARTAFGVPVRYPVACSPQAWAAAAWSAFLQAMLGIRPNAPARELVIGHPTLPPWLHWVEIRHLTVGRATVDLRFERVGDHTAVDVAAMRGDVLVKLVAEWERGRAR